MKTFVLSILVYSFALSCFCQAEISLRGRITDKADGEPLIGAVIKVVNTNKGTVTNEKGFFSLNLEKGTYNLNFSYIGYSTTELTIDFPETNRLDISLEKSSLEISEIVVSAKKQNHNIDGTQTGDITISAKELEKLPSLMGESDFLRIIQLTPGIQSANDANMGFYVRGGGADQNLILLDNVPVYNPFHVLGFFSVFNTDVIRSTKLIKSGMPANYGSRISSIIDVNTRNGSFQQFSVNGNIGLLASKITVEAPLVKNKLSLILSARKSYIDRFYKPIANSLFDNSSAFYKNSTYNFTDLNGKLSLRFSPKNIINLTAYSGIDNFELKKDDPVFKNTMAWGNRLLAINWIYQVNPEWSVQTTAGITQYNFELEAEQKNVWVQMLSRVQDYVAKTEISHASYTGQIIKFGAEFTYHYFVPNNIDATTTGKELAFGSNRELNGYESSVFYNHEFELSEKLKFNTGLRFVYYMQTGPYYYSIKNEIGQIYDSTYYHPGEKVCDYYSPEPRVSARYQINNSSSLKGAYTLNKQYVHMISSAAVTLPTDVWLPSTTKIKPQWGQQFTVGYYRNFSKNIYETSISLYFKDYHNQIELMQGIVNNFQDNSFEESSTFGKAYSYGAEIIFQKTQGIISGWVGYTLSETVRQFEEINDGNIFPAKYDRRHDLNLVLVYEISKKWNASASFILASGNAMTIPAYKYILEGNIIAGYGERNSFRMPVYHRLDLSLTYVSRKTEKFESSFNFSVFNVYNRQNPFYIYFEVTGNVYDYNLNITPKQICVFPIIPSLSWNFKF